MILASGSVGPEAFASPADHGQECLRRVHDADYLEDFLAARPTPPIISSELPINQDIVRWFLVAAHGTVTSVQAALERGACYHIGGGFHHAFASHAEGFCYINDVAVGAMWALQHNKADGVSVVDLDVHQGNGTAKIFQGEDRVFTFSMHQENNYPVKQKSDLDFGLDDGLGDSDYLLQLERGLAKAVLERRPELVIYVAGADPYYQDQLGGLNLTMEGLEERDRRVFAACERIGAPVVVVLAGGYAQDPSDTARIHFHTAMEMMNYWPWDPGTEGAAG